MLSGLKGFLKRAGGSGSSAPALRATTAAGQDFERRFLRNLRECAWTPHPLYSVFTQYDQGFYLANEAGFQHKYRCFYAVSKTIAPRSIIELGMAAGSSADAYLSAAPDAQYAGYDMFGPATHQVHGTRWDPYEIAGQLFASRGFRHCERHRADLRKLTSLPHADMLVVDAAHDFTNEYADLLLALTASPRFIFVDDAEGEEAIAAIAKFLTDNLRDQLDYQVPITYPGGGLVLKLKD